MKNTTFHIYFSTLHCSTASFLTRNAEIFALWSFFLLAIYKRSPKHFRRAYLIEPAVYLQAVKAVKSTNYVLAGKIEKETKRKTANAISIGICGSFVGCRTRIRTLTNGVRDRCATVTQFGNFLQRNEL